MEKLQIGEIRHRTLHRAGNAVLTIALPLVMGTTPAAKHTRELLSALSEFAEQTLAEKAHHALFSAAKEGRLFSFRPYTLTASLHKKSARHSVQLALTITLSTGDTQSSKALTFLWTADECLRKGRFGAAHRIKARKNA